MAKFTFIANKPSTKEGQLTFHATMTPQEFVKEGYAASLKDINVLINTKADSANTHPKKLFLAVKSPEGEQFSGMVSHNISSNADLTEPVISVVSTPEAPNEYRMLLHNRGVIPEGNFAFGFGEE